MDLANIIDSDGPGGTIGGIVRIVIRFFQFVLALTVAGLYGVDLRSADKADAYTDSKWVYAEVVAGISAVTLIVYAVTFKLSSPYFFAWEWVLFILWTALFGLFGNIYIGYTPPPDHDDQQRMKNAVWVDLTNMLLWFITAVSLTGAFVVGRGRRTLHTGRAKV